MAAPVMGLGLKVLEHMTGSATQLERRLSGDRLDVGGTAHPVGAKNAFVRAHAIGKVETINLRAEK